MTLMARHNFGTATNMKTWDSEKWAEVKGDWGESMAHGKAQLIVEVDIINIRITTECYILGKTICSHSPVGSWPGITKEKKKIHL